VDLGLGQWISGGAVGAGVDKGVGEGALVVGMSGWRVDIDRGSVDNAVDDGGGLWKTSRALWITANEGLSGERWIAPNGRKGAGRLSADPGGASS
jgi:hypothetical protein